MIDEYDFVVYLDADWEDGFQRNRQHFLISALAQRLEGRCNFLAVERPVCPLTHAVRKPRRLVQWLRDGGGPRRFATNLQVYRPVVLLHNVAAARIPGLREANRRMLRSQIKAVAARVGLRQNRIVAWIHHPYQLEDVGLLNEIFLVYDCYDDYVACHTNRARGRDIEQRERAILVTADCVFVASDRLLGVKSWAGRSVHVIPNGVEFEHFADAVRERHGRAPREDPPVLGFTGKISTRIDFAVLGRLATAHPEWNVAMIGQQESHRALMRDPNYPAFIGAPNVRLLGPKPYQDLPLYMRGFDVCLLPYSADNPFNSSCSPLKLYEYLATGKPIVSSDLPAVHRFDGLVRIAHEADQFVRHVESAVAERDPGLCERRMAAARENSWQVRAEQVAAVLEDCLLKKASRALRTE